MNGVHSLRFRSHQRHDARRAGYDTNHYTKLATRSQCAPRGFKGFLPQERTYSIKFFALSSKRAWLEFTHEKKSGLPVSFSCRSSWPTRRATHKGENDEVLKIITGIMAATGVKGILVYDYTKGTPGGPDIPSFCAEAG